MPEMTATKAWLKMMPTTRALEGGPARQVALSRSGTWSPNAPTTQERPINSNTHRESIGLQPNAAVAQTCAAKTMPRPTAAVRTLKPNRWAMP